MIIISLRGKIFAIYVLTDQGGRESRCSEKIINEKKPTDCKVFISKGMLHPFHLILEIQVKGTGMYSSRWTDYSITFDISESAVAIGLPAECFCDNSYIETKGKSNEFQSI